MPWRDVGDAGYWEPDEIRPQLTGFDVGDATNYDIAAPQWAQDMGFTQGTMGANQNSRSVLWNPTSNNGLGQWMGGNSGMVQMGNGDNSYEVWNPATQWTTLDRNPAIDADRSSQYNGTPKTTYGANGEFQGTGTWSGLQDEDMMDTYVTMLVAAAVGGAAAGAGGAGGAGAAEAGGGAVAGEAGAGAAGGGFTGTVSTTGGGSMFGEAMGTGAGYGGGAAAGGGGSMWSALGNQAVSRAGSSVLGRAIGGGSSGGSNVNDLASLFGGGLDYYNQNKASGDMLAWLKQRAAMTDNLYNPGTPEADLMRQTMERKDAAAGRNSQYGVRETDLGAKIAQIKADANTRMTSGVSGNYAAALNQRAAAPAGLMGALQGSGGLQNYSSLVSGLGNGISSWWNGGTGGGDWASGAGNYSQYLSDDYGQYL